MKRTSEKTATRSGVPCVIAFALFAAGALPAADMYTGFRERSEVNVAEGSTVQHTGFMLQSGESVVNKTGKGTWQVPVESIRQKAPFDIRVREGSLRLTTGGAAPEVAKPTSLLNRAMFWLSAKGDDGERSAMLSVSNGTDGVTYLTRWCDERETDTETPTTYYMECDWGDPAYGSRQGTNAVYMVTNGIPSVWMGGYNSGQMLRLRKDGANSAIRGIRDIFWVNGQYSINAYVIGNCDRASDGDYDSYNPRYNTPDSSSIWTGSHTWGGPCKTGYTFVDGAFIKNPYDTVAPSGFHLYEVVSGSGHGEMDPGYMDSLYTNGKYQNRTGGDFFNELVVFTNVLTQTERMQVAQWLMQKWGIVPSGASVGTVALADGAETALDVPSSGTFPSVSLKGTGECVKEGSGTLTLPNVSEFGGTLRIDSGSVRADSTEDVSLALVSGKRVTASPDNSGVLLSSASGVASGTTAKAGAGLVRVHSVPDDVNTVNVEAGVLALAAPSSFGADYMPAGDPVVTNGDFEATITSPGGNGQHVLSESAAYNGWWQKLYAGDNNGAGGYMWNEYVYSFKMARFLPVDNRQYIDIQGNEVMIYTWVTLPRDGYYDLTFDCVARCNYASYMVSVQVGPSLDELTTVGRFKPFIGPLVRTTYRLPYARAGRYLIGFRNGTLAAGAGGTLIDNVSVAPSDSSPDPSEWPIPNGDFELVQDMQTMLDANGERKGSITYILYGTGNTASNWTFDCPATTSDPYVGIYTPAIRFAHGQAYYSQAMSKYGRVRLLLASPDGTGTASTTFRPPAGTWRLVGDVANTPIFLQKRQQFNTGNSVTHASVTIGGVETSLGDFRQIGTGINTFTRHTWPEAFTVDGETDVTLTLQQTMEWGHVTLDNLALVRVVDGAGELVQDGSFESAQQGAWNAALTSDYWRSSANNVGQTYSYAYFCPYTYLPQFMGYSRYDGSSYVIICGSASIEQTLSFPSEGVYRLTFYAATREQNHANNGHNPIKASLVAVGSSVTNELCTVRVDTFNFVRHSALFRVPAAGQYVLRIEGMTVAAGSDRLTRLDGVSVKKATDLAPDATPDVPESASIEVAEGAKLRLDFPGNLKLDTVKYAGRSYSGTLTAENCPFILGPGSLEVSPKGTVLLFR